MAYKRKTWHEKMNPKMEAKTEIVDRKFADIPEGAKMFIPTPTDCRLQVSTP